MKKTDLKAIKNMEVKELVKKATDVKKELAGLVIAGDSRTNAKGSKDVKRVFKKRKDLAQILTILKQKEMVSQLSVLGSQLSDKGQPVAGSPVTEKQITEKPTSENRKPKTDNRKNEVKKRTTKL